MAFTNRTTNYGLPQWVANDKPTWLSDVNGAFETIDTNLKTVADSSSGLGEDIALLREQQTQQGQTITNLTADVSANTNSIGALQSKDTQLENSINSVQTIASANTNKIGDTPMTTTAQTLTGAVEELKKYNTYSVDEEIAVGTWIDGKTIYRKVIYLGNFPNSAVKTVPHNITNLKEFISITGIATVDNGNGWSPMPLVYRGQDAQYNTGFGCTLTHIRIETSRDRSNITGYAILEYTKIS